MMAGIKWQPTFITANQNARLLQPLLVAVMAVFANSLVILWIPEQRLITLVRNNVVNHRGLHSATDGQMHLAQRMLP